MQSNYKTNQKLWQKLSPQNPELLDILKSNHLENNLIILLKDDGDTDLLIGSSIKNELPLNPSQMINIIKNWQSRYISPTLKDLKMGTVVVTIPNMENSFLLPVFNEINKNYILKRITQQNGLIFYQVSAKK